MELKGDPPEDANSSITVSSSDGIYFNWSLSSSCVDIIGVIVKGGSFGNLYNYYPVDPNDEDQGDTYLHAPINPQNGEPHEISHIEFCYEGTFEIICPGDLTVECDGSTDPAETGYPTLSGECDIYTCGDVTLTYVDEIVSGSCPQEYTIIRTWTFADACGNSSSISQTITVIDDTPPTITPPSDVTDLLCNASIDPSNTGMATADDNCDGDVTITYSDNDLRDVCGNGDIIRTWTATDDCCNSTSADQTITIEDCGDFELIKTTDGGPNTNDNWSFTLSWDGTLVTRTTTPTDGILFDDIGPLSASETYDICELNVPAGWSSIWKIDTDGDNIPDMIVNTNPLADPLADNSNVCFSFGAGTSYPLPPRDGWTTCKLVMSVDNSFPGGDPRTPGYWKNWSSCSGGNQVATAANNGGCDEGYCTLDDILNDPGIKFCAGELTIDNCEDAVDLLDARDIISGKKMANDAAYTLMRALLAFRLNFNAGAGVCQDAFDAAAAAETLLCDIGFDGTGKYLRPKDAEYNDALDLANTLDNYNNGLLCSGVTSQEVKKSDTPSFKEELGGELQLNVYPQPFSDRVYFEVQSPETTDLKIEVYTMTGSKVETIYDDMIEENVPYRFEFDGNHYPGAMYIYRITTPKEYITGKLLRFK